MCKYRKKKLIEIMDILVACVLFKLIFFIENFKTLLVSTFYSDPSSTKLKCLKTLFRNKTENEHLSRVLLVH